MLCVWVSNNKKGHRRKNLKQKNHFFETLNKNGYENGIQMLHIQTHSYCESTNCVYTSKIITTVAAPVSRSSQNKSTTLSSLAVCKTSRKYCICITTRRPFVTMPEMTRLYVFVTQNVRCCPVQKGCKTLKNGRDRYIQITENNKTICVCFNTKLILNRY